MNKITAILLGLILILCCVSKHQAIKKEMVHLDIQHFKDTTTVANVLSGAAVEFSTLNGYRPEKFIGVGWLDSFLKGYVNKKTGKRYYQVYQFFSYQGRGWRLYNRVDYQTPEGKTSKPLTRYHRELLNCTSSRGCTYEEHVVFDIEERLLRKIAELAPSHQEKVGTKEKIPVFLYQLSSNSGPKRKYWLLPAEAAGLLERMDEYVKNETLEY
jgi:hypothetical protein